VVGATGTAAQLAGVARKPASVNAGAARLPQQIEVVRKDVTVPETLDRCRDGMDGVFLVWTAPPATAGGTLERIAKRTIGQPAFVASTFEEATAFEASDNSRLGPWITRTSFKPELGRDPEDMEHRIGQGEVGVAPLLGTRRPSPLHRPATMRRAKLSVVYSDTSGGGGARDFRYDKLRDFLWGVLFWSEDS
jgi:hypothetical protein